MLDANSIGLKFSVEKTMAFIPVILLRKRPFFTRSCQQASSWSILLFLLLSKFSLSGQDFADSTSFAFPDWTVQGLANASMEWGDYDNDGDYDVFMMGDSSSTVALTTVYNNDGGIFSEVGAIKSVFTDVSTGDIALHDFNADGFIDVFICGKTPAGAFVSNLYRNNGAGGFVLESSSSALIEDVTEGTADWGDYDNDGDPDLLLLGLGGSGRIARIYENQGGGIFASDNGAATSLTGISAGTGQWIDVNSDGRLDIVISGFTGTLGSTSVYLNGGDGTFTNLAAGLPNLRNASLDTGDYDNDGDEDLLLTGQQDDASFLTGIYRNNGNNTFTASFSTVGIENGAVQWGDYNEDNFLDFIISGNTAAGDTLQIYRNNGAGGFVATNPLIPAVSDGFVRWGDYNGNGTLDLLISGIRETDTAFSFYENQSLPIANILSPPSGFAAAQIGSSINFSWVDPAGYPANSLSYSFSLSKVSGQTDLRPPLANISNGFRRVIQRGELIGNTLQIQDLEPGTYYWNVEGINRQFEGTGFATEQVLVVQPPDFIDTTDLTFSFSPDSLDRSFTAWGDYDGDDDLDLIILGETSSGRLTKIYRNNGTSFSDSGIALEQLKDGEAAWGDFDGDGDLDLLLSGSSASGPKTILYRNDAGVFTAVASSFTQVEESSLDWGDYDKDGDMDVALAGNSAGGRVSEIYRNDGGGTFVKLSASIDGISNGIIRWGDLNKNGFLDFLISGETTAASVSRVYKNDGNGSFAAIGSLIGSLTESHGDWGDYDNDGDLDIVLSGFDGASPKTTIYRNNGNESFSSSGIPITGVQDGSSLWGDFNNDGLLDLLVTGKSGAGLREFQTSLYSQGPVGTFTAGVLNTPALTNAGNGSFANWGDYDKDGKLDILLTGQDTTGRRIFTLFNNKESSAANVPTVPLSLQALQSGTSVELSWDIPGSVPADLKDGLSYNVFIGTSKSSVNIKPPHSNITNGFRRIVKAGNTKRNSFTIQNIATGKYYWSVQTIDQDFEGSAFAEIDSFTYVIPDFIDSTATIFAAIPSGLNRADIHWVDYDNDDDLDLFMTGNSSTGISVGLYRNDAGNFSFVPTAIAGVRDGSVAWKDFDQDGDLDVLVSGESSSGPSANMYRNDGGGSFVQIATVIPARRNSHLAVADFDQDGDLDVLITGQDNTSSPQTDLYRNDGSFSFSQVNESLIDLGQGEARWIDLNQDGFLDIIMSGNANTGAVTKTYRNNGPGIFTEVANSLVQLGESSMDLADFDGDGLIDLLISGNTGLIAETKVYKNLGNFGFQDFTGANSIVDLSAGSVAWGDYDNDGYSDILLTGTDNLLERFSRIYHNNAGANFTFDEAASVLLRDANNGSAARWGDYDNDGKLDIAIVGQNSNGPTSVFQVLRNIKVLGTATPSPPTALIANQVGDRVDLSWTPSVPNPANPGQRETYQLYIGSSSQNGQILSPSSNILNGYRKLSEAGDLKQSFSSIRGLATGTYFWGVQAIDANHKGSAFSAEGIFTYTAPEFTDITPSVFNELPPELNGTSVAWGDYDNDDDLDFAIMGRDTLNTIQTLIFDNINGQFIKNEAASNAIIGAYNGDLAWADYDNDGDLDLLISGSTASNAISKLYRNDGAGVFTDLGLALPNLSASSLDWADYNNDGLLDFAISGTDGTNKVGRIFRNRSTTNPASPFSEATTITGITNGVLKWSDMDSDGDMDLILIGEGSSLLSEIYENLGNATFNTISGTTRGITPLKDVDADWGDYNNDGFPDLLYSGLNSSNIPFLFYSFNNGNLTFNSTSIPGASSGSLRWGDYDDDGFLDIAAAGKDILNQRASKIYKNNNGLFFTELVLNSNALVDVDSGAVIEWVDFDNDKKLDLVIGGSRSSSANFLGFYKNRNAVANRVPLKPENLNEVQDGERMVLSWDPPTGYPANLVKGLTYNVYIGTNTADEDVKASSSAIPGGYRRIVRSGNTSQSLSIPLTEIAGGSYFWSVQSVDQDYEGSEFATENTFVFSPPTFVDVSTSVLGTSAKEIDEADLAWGDYDNDGDLDLIAIGDEGPVPSTVLYKNNGGIFANSGITFPLVQDGFVTWTDVNGDSWLDLFISGEGLSGRTSQLFINNGGSSFTAANLGFLGMDQSAGSWADYDNDGDMDLLIIGSDNGTAQTKLYRNSFVTDGTFTEVSISIPGLRSGMVKWADFNNDGWPDILISGLSSSGATTKVFFNNANGGFVDSGISLVGLNNVDGDIADYDNDGDLDFIIGGDAGSTPTTLLYRNELAGSNFTLISSSILGVSDGSLRWGDYNSDGFSDLLLSGKIAGGRTTQLYQNNGAGGFSEDVVASAIFENVFRGSIAVWGDYDGNKTLDIALAGRSTSGRILRIIKNLLDPANNIVPSTPTNLSATQVDDKIILKWNPPTSGDPSIVTGYSYNLFIGKSSSSEDLKPAMSNLSSGLRKIVRLGNLYKADSLVLENIPTGTYFWSIQSVDQDFEGSAFADVSQFNFFEPSFINQTGTVFSSTPVGLSEAAIAWGDYNNDGDLDLFISGASTSGPVSTLYDNNANTLSPIASGLPALQNGSAAWGEYDNDGQADLLLTGLSGGGRITAIFRNNGDQSFSNVASFEGVDKGDANWADYDNDGDYDIAFIGEANGGLVANIFRNDNGSFTNINESLLAVKNGVCLWADYDNDGDQDLLIAGENQSGDPDARLYVNQGQDNFEDSGISIEGFKDMDAAWGDINNDNFVDLVLTGDNDSGLFTKVFENNDGNSFNEIDVFDGVAQGAIELGDYNDDGYKDLAISGLSLNAPSNRYSKIYENDNGNGFNLDLDASAALPQLFNSDLAWIDYDGNGKLDLSISGATANNSFRLNIFRNIGLGANTIPLSPMDLEAVQRGDEYEFSWNANENIPGSQSAGHSYNIYIGSSPNGEDVFSPLANTTNGNRKVIALGNVGQVKSWRIKDLAPGTYSWGVQAIDGDWEGSDFTAGGEFTYIPPDFVDGTRTAFGSIPDGWRFVTIGSGDYDNDGDLDLIVAGEQSSQDRMVLYENQGASFVNSGLNFQGISNGEVRFEDINNDGWLDIMATGVNPSGSATLIYVNQQNGTFDIQDLGIVALGQSSFDWGDYDNDGDRDLIITGNNNSDQRVTEIYVNDGDGNLTNVNSSIIGIRNGQLKWGDFDRDNDLDLFITGESSEGSITRLYENRGLGSLVELSNPLVGGLPFQGLSNSKLDLGDLDNDGYLDLIIIGQGPTGEKTVVYKNNGDRSFSLLEELQGVRDGDLALGDYNDDGWMDLLIIGSQGSEVLSLLYQNSTFGGGFILDATNSGAFLPMKRKPSIIWTDVNGDKKLDAVLAGESQQDQDELRIYLNIENTPNQGVQAPQNLIGRQTGQSISFSWDPPAGVDPAIVNGLTYNLYIGTSPFEFDVHSPMADLGTGERRIVSFGKLTGTSLELTGLDEGTYYWSVQAIDQDFEGSPFAPENSFEFSPPDLLDVTALTFPQGLPEGLSSGDLSWADFDNDDDLDLLILGESDSGPMTNLYRNNGNGTFTNSGIALDAVKDGNAAWGDYDNNGLIDLAICGDTGNGRILKIFSNNINSFTELLSLDGISNGEIIWGDYDNDGDLDLLTAGELNNSGPVKIYNNSGSGSFEAVNLNIGNPSACAIDWGDFDNDGYLDFVYVGNTGLGSVAEIRRNNQKGSFADIQAELLGVSSGSVEWGDYDNDGFLDLVVSGNLAGALSTRIYRNLGNNNFDEIFSIQGMRDGESRWADYNNDGFLDLAITGKSGTGVNDRLTEIYRNIQGIEFRKDTLNSDVLSNFDQGSSLAWGDYDMDGRIDLALMGRSMSPDTRSFKLYKNAISISNPAPPVPVNLQTEQIGNQLILSWSLPQGIDPTIANGYSYSIYLGSNPGISNIRTPLSRISGKRIISRKGDINSFSWIINDLDAGEYYWSVQSIDQNFEGSAFAAEQSFSFNPPDFIDVTSNTNLESVFLDLDNASIAWGDYDNDRDLDLLATGNSSRGIVASLYENRGNGNFESKALLPDSVANGDITWLDYNNDGFLDIVMTGESRNGPITKVFRNTQSGSFIDVEAGLPGLKNATIDWGDVDNDGDQDLLLAGLSSQGGGESPFSGIYLNSGRDRFIFIESNFERISNGQASFVDYNNDGRLDVFISGLGIAGPSAALYKNEGNRSFVLINTLIEGFQNSAFDWGDFNNDGYDDLVIAGKNALNELKTTVYLNDAGQGFSNAVSLLGVENGSVAWGDFNEDGFMDILLNGTPDISEGSRTFKLYRNNRTGGFIDDIINSEILLDINEGSKAIWGDYDNDGKLDILATGKAADGPELRSMILYKNTVISSSVDNTPAVPSIIGEDRLLDRVVLKWNPPAGAVAQGYTYNVYIGLEQPQDRSIISPLANTANGNRKVVMGGNIGHNTELEIFGLPSGNYWWSVQAIDQEFQPSAFANVDSFFYNSPVFIDVSTSALPLSALSDIKDGSFDWGDYDNDGDLDMLVVGVKDTVPFTTLYKNNGRIGFTETQDSFPGLDEAAIAWGDLNNDGFLDIALTGAKDGDPQTYFFKNNQSTGFEDISSSQGLAIQGFRSGSIDWGDFTNDGYDDLVLTGFTDAGPTSRVYANNRGEGFIELQPIVGVTDGDAAFGDYNGDGLLDLAVIGFTGSDLIGVVLKNQIQNGVSNTFITENTISNTIADASGGNVSWADFDNDGDLDLLLTGDDGSQPITELYRNLSDGTFENTNISFRGITDGMAAWGDYNEDGFPDIVISGRSGLDGTDRITELYRYDTTQATFVVDEIASSLLTNTNGGSKLAFGDYDRDGKIDLLLTGKTNDNPDQYILRLFKNQDVAFDSIPEPPINLLADNLLPVPNAGFSLTLSWDAPDTTLLANGYSYNLVFGDAESESFRKSPLADTLSGFRRVYRIGNVNQTRSWTINGLPEGRFYWSVQSVDQDFEASSFAPFDEVIIENQSFADVSGSTFTTPPLAIGEGTLIWGDIDNDRDLDIFSTGEIDNNRIESALYLNDNRTGTFTLDQSASSVFQDVKRSDAAFGDYNLDGYLDLLICGEDTAGIPHTNLYRNLQDGTFEFDSIASAGLIDVSGGALDWGDFDNDGDPDILISGRPQSGGPITRVYRNLGNGQFANYINQRDNFVGVDIGDVEWGDYDKDGNLDFVITGRDIANNPLTEVYHNEGEDEDGIGLFISISSSSPAPITDVKESTVAWGDFNNDGFLDLFLAGEETKNDFRPVTRFYFFDTLNNVFTERVIPGLVDIKNGQLEWGDYNEDGFQDLLISGQTSDTSRTTRIYQNNRGLGFNQDLRSSSILQDIGQGQSSWGDYNGDGKLDVILSGVSNTEPKERSFTLYQNIDFAFDQPVLAPINPRANIVGNKVTLNWNPPNVDPSIQNGLSYNVYVARVTDDIFRKSGNADTLNGFRRIVRMGNTGHSTTWTLKSLIGGNYCWGVQTIGADFQGSVFAKPSTCFSYEPPIPQITDSLFAETFIWNDPENTAESWIRVADNDKVGEVRLYYKPISRPQTSWTIIDVDEVSGTQYILKNFTSKIDPVRVNNEEIGLEYFFEVTSAFFDDVIVRTDTHYTYIQFKQNANYNIDGLNIPELQDGPNMEDYNLISVPLNLGSPSVDAVFEELGNYNIDNWRLFHYNGEKNVEHFARDNQGISTILSGIGYWLIARALPGPVNTGEGVTVKANHSSPYTVELRQGFNQIGNPYNFNLSWQDILNANPSAVQSKLGKIWTYSQGYQNNGVIRRFRGAFVFSDSALTLSIPVTKNLSVQRLSNPDKVALLKNPLHLSNWRVNLSVSSGNKSYPFGAFGMHKLASESKDEFDWMLPPRINGNVDVSFKREEFFYPHFTRDIVPTQQNYIWEFSVYSSMRPDIVEIEWENEYFGSSERQLYLLDLESHRITNMREQELYAFFAEKPSRKFRVFFGDQAFIDEMLQPDRILLGHPYPNPATSAITIPFSLPQAENGSEVSYNVSIRIFNSIGQRVAGFDLGKYDAGFQKWVWNLNGQFGRRVPIGSYIYLIQAEGNAQTMQGSGRLEIRP